MQVHAIRNGIFTITNTRTQEHRTFRVRTQGDHVRFAPGQRILSVLTGPNNATDYTAIAFLNAHVAVWKRHRHTKFAELADFIWKFFTDPDPEWSEQFEVQWETTCIRCNKRLTHPLSIAVGIGPVCGERHGNNYGLDSAVIQALKLEAKIEAIERGTV